MAQLKDLLVSGPSRLIGKLFANEVQLTTLNIPTTSNGTTYGAGTSGQVLVTNGTSAYWKTLATGDVGSGTLPVSRGGTGNTVATQGGVVYGNGSTYALTAAGSSGQVLQSNGTSAPSWITATNANTASTIVKRDASGNFSAGTITATLSGNASSATKLGSSNVGSSTQPIYLEGGTPKAATAYSAAAVLSASKFTAAQSVTLTGDVTGTASSVAGWSIATTLATQSGVTGGSYGLSADASPAHGGKFKVPYVTVNTKGLVTGIAEKEITLPTDNNTDTNVSQTITTTDSDYRILFSGTADDTTRSEGARKGTNLRYNPSTNEIKMVNGTLWVQGGSNAGSNSATNRLTLTSGMPANLAYNTSKRGTRIYSNGIAFADPYNGNSNNDSGWIREIEETANSGVLEIATGDDANESIVVRQYNTSSAVSGEITLLNASHQTLLNTTLPRANNTYDLGSSSAKWNAVYASTFNGTATSATTANKLNTNAGSLYQPVYFTNGIPTIGSGYTVEYIVGTQTASTNAWTGVTKDTALYDGKMIMYVLPYAGTGSGATLNLTLAGGSTTGAKNIYRYANTTAITTHYAAGSRILLIYDATNNRWNSSAWYDSNSTDQTYSAAGANREAETSGNGGIGLHGYSLQLMTVNQKWSSVACTSGSTANNSGTTTTKAAATANFLIDSPIFYMSNNSYVAPGGSANVNGYTTIALDFRYNTTGTISLTVQKPVYLVGIPNVDNSTFKLPSSNWWTQTLPTSNDGKIYILLGLAYSSTNIYLQAYHPIYYHNGEHVVPYQTPHPLKIAYFGSDTDATAGWYKVCTVSQSGYSNCNLNLLVTSGYSRKAQGLLHVHVRCDNGTANNVQALKWMYRYGFDAGDFYYKDNGNNTWSLYVHQTVTRYGRIQIQILTETNTSASQWDFHWSNNTTPESSAPTGGTASTDGATVEHANSATSATTASKLGSSTLGSTTQPIYLDSGTAKQCSVYAGGTAITLNGTSKAANTASFYAPTASGTANQVLISGGANTAPSWTNQSNLSVGSASSATTATSAGKITTNGSNGQYWAMTSASAQGWKTTTVSNEWTGGTTSGPTIKTTVNGVAGTAVAIPSAGASASGVITTGAQTIAGAKTLSSILTIKGIKGTSNTDYGTALPSSGSEGQLFFQISDEVYEIPAGGTTGQALIKNSNTDRDVKWGPVGGQQTPNNSVKFYPSGSTSTSANTGDAVFNTSVYVQNSVLFGAAWNDYAEYRETTTPVKAGRVVIENGDDTLSLSTERMQPGAEIVSDTFGFAIGQTEKSKTAIAAAGRVLAYPHEPRRTYRPGQPVCSGPNGTVSQMTDEEARMYPWCIIGTVSSIPEYDTWGEDNIKVDGRIWVRIR